METNMPFTNHDLDPEHIESMRAAFCRVCDVCNTDDPITNAMASPWAGVTMALKRLIILASFCK